MATMPGTIDSYPTSEGRRWRARWREPDGTRTRRRSKAGFATRHEAQAWLLSRLAGTPETDGTPLMTYRDLDRAYRQARDASITTRKAEESLNRTHIMPTLGHLPIGEIRAETIAELCRKVHESGRTWNTVQRIHTVVAGRLAYAVDLGLIGANPAASRWSGKPTARQIEAERRPRRAWTKEQVDRFVEWNRDDPLRGAWLLALHAGLRRSEILALRPADVDWDKATIRVSRARHTGHGFDVVQPTKNGKPRTVTATITLLEALRERQDGKADGELFFPCSCSSLSTRWRSRARNFAKACPGVPVLGLHELRHTHASVLYELGVDPLTIQERLGHSTVSMTLSTYAHLSANAQRVAVATLEGEGAGGPHA